MHYYPKSLGDVVVVVVVVAATIPVCEGSALQPRHSV